MKDLYLQLFLHHDLKEAGIDPQALPALYPFLVGFMQNHPSSHSLLQHYFLPFGLSVVSLSVSMCS